MEYCGLYAMVSGVLNCASFDDACRYVGLGGRYVDVLAYVAPAPK